MVTQSDFLAAVRQISAERNIEEEEIFTAIEEAMITVYKKYFGEGENLFTDLNRETGEIKIIADKKVVKKVTDSRAQIALETAKEIEPRLKIGDHIEVDITPKEGFGRLAAQVARQVIMQKVREAEKEVLVKKFEEQLGTVKSGIIQKMEGPVAVIEVDKMQVQMPPEEQMFREFYKSGDRKRFYLKEVRKLASGSQLIVSRADPEFLAKLFEMEVPEIATGTVEIKSVAREAGSRSKAAVVSHQEGVDPIGACVGQKGVRINSITDELLGEKIDIILWDEDIEKYIANALSPAEVIAVKLDKEEQIASVKVPEDQLSLAIGKEGQNVRLAAKLTGWRIDIAGPEGKVIGTSEAEEEVKKEEKKKEKKEEGNFSELELSSRVKKALTSAGIKDEKQLEQMSAEELSELKGIGKKAVEEITAALKK